MGTGYRWVQYKTSQQKKLNPLENIYFQFQDTPSVYHRNIGICSLRYYIQIRGGYKSYVFLAKVPSNKKDAP
jgi:hypothetical protein